MAGREFCMCLPPECRSFTASNHLSWGMEQLHQQIYAHSACGSIRDAAHMPADIHKMEAAFSERPPCRYLDNARWTDALVGQGCFERSWPHIHADSQSEQCRVMWIYAQAKGHKCRSQACCMTHAHQHMEKGLPPEKGRGRQATQQLVQGSETTVS